MLELDNAIFPPPKKKIEIKPIIQSNEKETNEMYEKEKKQAGEYYNAELNYYNKEEKTIFIIPIYFGCKNIKEIYPEDGYILIDDINKFFECKSK